MKPTDTYFVFYDKDTKVGTGYPVSPLINLKFKDIKNLNDLLPKNKVCFMVNTPSLTADKIKRLAKLYC